MAKKELDLNIYQLDLVYFRRFQLKRTSTVQKTNSECLFRCSYRKTQHESCFCASSGSQGCVFPEVSGVFPEVSEVCAVLVVGVGSEGGLEKRGVTVRVQTEELKCAPGLKSGRRGGSGTSCFRSRQGTEFNKSCRNESASGTSERRPTTSKNSDRLSAGISSS